MRYLRIQEESYYELVEHLLEVATDEENNLTEVRKAVIKLFEAQTKYYVLDIPSALEVLELDELKAYICKNGNTMEFEISGKGTMTELLQVMSKAQLAKQTYYNYKLGIKGKETIVEKKFLVNMVLFLGLDSYTAHSLIEAEGYSVQYSAREEDKIVTRALKLGIGGWLLEELLEAKEGIVFKKRFFQNRKQSLAFIRYYNKQDELKQQSLTRQYTSALQIADKKMGELGNRLVNQMNYWNNIVDSNEIKNELLLEEYVTLFKSSRDYLSPDEIEEELTEWLLEGIDLVELEKKVKGEYHYTASYLKARKVTIKKEYQNRVCRITEIKNKIKEAHKKTYTLNDLFNYYKSWNDEEDDEDILAVEALQLTYKEIDAYKYLKSHQKEGFWRDLVAR